MSQAWYAVSSRVCSSLPRRKSLGDTTSVLRSLAACATSRTSVHSSSSSSSSMMRGSPSLVSESEAESEEEEEEASSSVTTTTVGPRRVPFCCW